MVSGILLWEMMKITIGGISNITATAELAPALARPPEEILLRTDGSVLRLSSYI